MTLLLMTELRMMLAFQTASPAAIISAGAMQTSLQLSSDSDTATDDVWVLDTDEDEDEPLENVIDDDEMLFSSDWALDEDGNMELVEEAHPRTTQTTPWKKNARWNSLNPKIRDKMIKEGQEKAKRNKETRTEGSKMATKLKMHKMYKDYVKRSKQENRVWRPLPLYSSHRTPLNELTQGATVNGTVISLTDFGAYVDIGSDVDGLLHISQMSPDGEIFVPHPRVIMSPGDEISVIVSRFSSDLRKLSLSMPHAPQNYPIPNADEFLGDGESIGIAELALDDELWGQLKRVTNYGAFVEVGAEVDAFLHFMDHPLWGDADGSHPSTFMKRGDRVRVWVSDLDPIKERIKVTALRPTTLPVLRRDLYRS